MTKLFSFWDFSPNLVRNMFYELRLSMEINWLYKEKISIVHGENLHIITSKINFLLIFVKENKVTNCKSLNIFL